MSLTAKGRARRFPTGIMMACTSLLLGVFGCEVREPVVIQIGVETPAATLPAVPEHVPAPVLELGVVSQDPGAYIVLHDAVTSAPAESAILESRQSNTRLLSLSEGVAVSLLTHGGLAVTDVADPRQLVPLSRVDVPGKGLAQYKVGEQIWAISAGETVFDASTQTWQEVSHLVRVDLADPRKPLVLGRHHIAGRVVHSELQDDVLRVLSYQSKDCWQCVGKPRLVVQTLSLQDGELVVSNPLVAADLGAQEPVETLSYWSHDTLYLVANTGEEGPTTLRRVHRSPQSGELKRLTPIVLEGQVKQIEHIFRDEQRLYVIEAKDGKSFVAAYALSDAQSWEQATLLHRSEIEGSLRLGGFAKGRAYVATQQKPDTLEVFVLGAEGMSLETSQMFEGPIAGVLAQQSNWIVATPDEANKVLKLSALDLEAQGGARVRFKTPIPGSSAPQPSDRIALQIDPASDRLLVRHRMINPVFKSATQCSQPQLWAVSVLAPGVSGLRFLTTLRTEQEGSRLVGSGAGMLELSDDGLAFFPVGGQAQMTASQTLDLAPATQAVASVGKVDLAITQSRKDAALSLEVRAQDELGTVLSSVSMGVLGDSVCEDGRDVQVRKLLVQGERAFILYTHDADKSGELSLGYADLSDPSAPMLVRSANKVRVQPTPDIWMGRTKIESATMGTLRDRLVIATLSEVTGADDTQGGYSTTFEVFRVNDRGVLSREAVLTRPAATYAGGLLDGGIELGSWYARPGRVDGQLYYFYDHFYVDAQDRVQYQSIPVPGVPVGFDNEHRRLFTLQHEVEATELSSSSCETHPRYFAREWQSDTCYLLNAALNELVLLPDFSTSLLTSYDFEASFELLGSFSMHRGRMMAFLESPQTMVGEGKDRGVRVAGGLGEDGFLKISRFEAAPRGQAKYLDERRYMVRQSIDKMRVYDLAKLDDVSEQRYRVPQNWCDAPLAQDDRLTCALGEQSLVSIEPTVQRDGDLWAPAVVVQGPRPEGLEAYLRAPGDWYKGPGASRLSWGSILDD